jgi:hypothetical protein
MKFDYRRNPLSQRTRDLSLTLVAGAIGVLVIFANSQTTHAQNTLAPKAISGDVHKIVYPMLISVTGLNTTGLGAQHSIKIQLEAGNNMTIEPNYANATR